MTFNPITSIEFLCHTCNISVKIPVAGIESEYASGEKKLTCPGCQREFEGVEMATTAAARYVASIIAMETLTSTGDVKFLST